MTASLTIWRHGMFAGTIPWLKDVAALGLFPFGGDNYAAW
jgi:hypothetical protein